MSDITENEEIDRDTVPLDELERLFNRKYNLLSEIAVSIYKSYVNKLSVSKSFNIALSLADNSIEVYQLNKASLSRVSRLSGHDKTLTEVVFCPENDNLLYSSSLDGCVKLWDTRVNGTSVQEYKDVGDIPKAYECMDVSQNGRVLCAGSNLVEEEAYVVFWDQRNPAPLGGYWNTHTDDVTQVKFHKKRTEILATGSSDGLLNVYNIMEQSEDEALSYTLNIENSVEKITWLDDKRVACITQSDDLQIWDTDSGDLLDSYTRDKIARAMKRSRADDCYVVDAFTADGRTVVVAGSHAGDGGVLRSMTAAGSKLVPSATYCGNRQVVRCCHHDKHSSLVVTTGESGLVSVWTSAEVSSGAGDSTSNAVSKQRPVRHKPY